MKFQSLCGSWEFRQSGTDEWLPAAVPGGVHTDLMSNNMIPDPFVADNEKHVQWVAETDWEYHTSFSCSEELLMEDRVYLVCDGLDTLAEVHLNGVELGKTENMFRQYRWEIKSQLKNGKNDLTILFKSPVRYCAERQEIRPMPGVSQAIPGGSYLRKAPCQFGWDWGPKLPPIGIWKDIRLEGYQDGRIEEIHLSQEHKESLVSLSAKITLENWVNSEYAIIIGVHSPDGKYLENQIIARDKVTSIFVDIPEPKLWWPNGYGEQPLYEVLIELRKDTNVLDSKTYQVGLRTVELRQQPDEWGKSFTFFVNGLPIIAKGSNWIPADSFPTRISDSYLEMLIKAAADTHQNMLRVWGGGFYEEERFYDLCDRYGILVWQDFIFSCSVYPMDNVEFLENVRVEVIENIRRLRHRASLALWCGNNEMEWGWVEWGWKGPKYQDMKLAYDRFFHQTLPEWCQAEDPEHDYWPSSPSSDIPFENPNGQHQGDAHYWDVWHGRKPFTAYRDQFPRFMSEFGFQALPPLATISTYADKKDWNMTSYIMEMHQKNASGNSLMVGQMLDTFRLPKDFSSLVYLSLALQAEGIRYGVEHWRRYPERVSGILYWQLNDCWPVASWSSLDYFGRWKALHYAARKFFAPLLLSIEDSPPIQTIFVTNEMTEKWLGNVRWSLETLNGDVLSSGQAAVKAEAQSAVQVAKVDFSEHITDENIRETIFITELWQKDSLVSRQTATFAPIKHLSLEDPCISSELYAEEDQLVINITSQSMAFLVELSLADVDVIFSDNYFNLPPGRTMRITCPLPPGWTVEKARKSLSIRSVFDSYAHGEK